MRYCQILALLLAVRSQNVNFGDAGALLNARHKSDRKKRAQDGYVDDLGARFGRPGEMGGISGSSGDSKERARPQDGGSGDSSSVFGGLSGVGGARGSNNVQKRNTGPRRDLGDLGSIFGGLGGAGGAGGLSGGRKTTSRSLDGNLDESLGDKPAGDGGVGGINPSQKGKRRVPGGESGDLASLLDGLGGVGGGLQEGPKKKRRHQGGELGDFGSSFGGRGVGGIGGRNRALKDGKLDESLADKPSSGNDIPQREICPKEEFVVPRPLRNLERGTLIANGCGPQGLPLKEPFGLWRCCNRHDVCFSSCGTSFGLCETRFAECMAKRCNQSENAGRGEECRKKAGSFSSMTKMFGGASHAQTMHEVCDCAKTLEEAEKKRREFIVDIYTRFGPSEKADDASFIDGLLEKHKGNEGTLYYDLITQYGGANGFVEFDNVPNTFLLEGPSEVGPDRSEL